MRCASRYCVLSSVNDLNERTDFADHITWLQEAQRLHELAHSAIKIPFLVQVISIPSMDTCHPGLANTLIFGQSDGSWVQTAFVDRFKLFGRRVLF